MPMKSGAMKSRWKSNAGSSASTSSSMSPSTMLWNVRHQSRMRFRAARGRLVSGRSAQPPFLHQSRSAPTERGASRSYHGSMNEKRLFADVDLPFHVWVREGRRWVLRNTAAGADGENVSPSAAAMPSATERRPDFPNRPV
jgi:hypothetical protein